MTAEGAGRRRPLDLIMVEDSAIDAELVVDALNRSGLMVAVRRVDDEPSFGAALEQRLPDAILADWTLPRFSGRRALAIAQERCRDVPLIFVSGTIAEVTAIDAMRQGAADYVFKHQLQRLGAAVERALREATERRALRESEQRFRQMFERNDAVMLLIEPDSGAIIDANAAAGSFYGYAIEHLRAIDIEQLNALSAAEIAAERARALHQERNYFIFPHRLASGEVRTVEVHSSPVEVGGRTLLFSIVHDISDRMVAEEALRRSEAKFSAIFSLTPEPMALTRLDDGVLLEVSHSYAEWFGYRPDELVGRTTLPGDLGLWLDAEQRRFWKEAIERNGEVLNFEAPLRRKDGSIVTVLISGRAVDLGTDRCAIVAIHDITEQKQHAQHLEDIAHHDALTGLPNRLLLSDRLHQAIAQNLRAGTRIAVCYLDLDGFKEVNDRHGHDAGDQVLIEVANRLMACVRGGDTIARLGGDEFVVLLAGLADDEECRMALERLLQTVSMPYVAAGGFEGRLSASIGVTVFPSDRADADTLVRHADHAMYAAKQAGKSRYQMFDIRLEQRIEARHATLRGLADALQSGQFRLHYQPKVDCRRGRVVGVEALIRWQHPTLGLLSPAEFVPLIEDTDLAPQVGEWVIREALSRIGTWRREGLDIAVSVNAFVRQLLQPGFADALAALLDGYPEVTADHLQIEIVETAALRELDTIRQVIEDCRRLGVTFSLDDFGTGYSTLAHLRHLPATEIKIDQSFVGQMLARSEDLMIVEAIIGLAQAFDRSVVAEGAETSAHIVRLLGMGCAVMQGYALARPMPADDVACWVRSFRPNPAWYPSADAIGKV